MIFVLLFMLVLARITIGSAGIEKIKVLIGMISVNSTNIGAYLGTADMIKLAESLSVVFVVGLILFAVLGCLYSLTFALTPFVLEKYNLKGAKAMSESARLMKGHRWTLVLLYLSYILWFMLTVGIIGLIGGIIPIPLIFDLITAILATYLFGAELNVSLAVFFEEIDYEDKKII